MATPSSILAWKIPWTEEPGWLQSMGSQELDMTEQLRHTRFSEESGALKLEPLPLVVLLQQPSTDSLTKYKSEK